VVGLPPGGRVQIDGKTVDATAPISVDPGSHRITAQANGYESFSTTAAVARGVEAPITINMARLPAEKPVTPPIAGLKSVGNAAIGGQCQTPGVESYNLNNLCFDDRPVATVAPLVPIGEETTGTPKPSIVLVLVQADGTVGRVTSKQISDNPSFHLKALEFAKTLTFRPAQKDGQAVAAWFEVLLRPTRTR
jgi:hypothetical protein